MYDEHWTDREAEALKKASSFEDLADVGVVILGRMGLQSKPVIQICGPMTTDGLGDLEKNMSRFRRAVKQARQNDVFVFDQAVFQDAMIRLVGENPQPGYPMGILDVFYRRVFASGHIKGFLFFHDWHTSFGTRWEMEVAQEYGIDVRHYPAHWWEELHR
jgi:hypothetical protein